MSVDAVKQFESDDEEQRRLAVDSLKGDCSTAATKLLYKALGDESWRVRKTAVEVLLLCSEKDLLSDLIVKSAEFLREEENPGLRNSAIEILIKLKTSAVPSLIELLKDENPEIRKFSCDILGEIKDNSSVTAIGELLNDDDNNVRASASEALGEIGGKGVIDILIKALDIDNLWLRFATLEALGKMGEGVPFEPVVKFFEDQMLRKGVLDALQSTGDIKSVEFFIKGLEDKSATTRNSAVIGLAQSLENLSLEEKNELKEDILKAINDEFFLTMLDSHVVEVRCSAVKVLAVVEKIIHQKTLMKMASNGEMEIVITDLLASSKENSLSFILSEMQKFDDNERAYSCKVLGSIGSAAAVDVLKSALKDNHGHTRKNALLSLGRLNSMDSLKEIAGLLNDEFDDVAEASVAALSQIGSFSLDSKGRVMKFLSTDFKEKNPRERKLIIMFIGYVGDKGDLDVILSALKDEDSNVRQASVLALGSINPKNTLSYLSVPLTDESNDVRLATINVMGNINSAESEDLLKLALKDTDSWIKSAAVRSLARIGTSSAVEAIGGVIKDDTVVVSITAIDSIADLKGSDGIKFIEEGLSHSDSAVVSSAKEKIESLKAV